MNLAKWVFTMDGFYKLNKIVRPKKVLLALAEQKYANVMKKINRLKADQIFFELESGEKQIYDFENSSGNIVWKCGEKKTIWIPETS